MDGWMDGWMDGLTDGEKNIVERGWLKENKQRVICVHQARAVTVAG